MITAGKQNSEIVFEFKSDTAVSIFTFCFSCRLHFGGKAVKESL